MSKDATVVGATTNQNAVHGVYKAQRDADAIVIGVAYTDYRKFDGITYAVEKQTLVLPMYQAKAIMAQKFNIAKYLNGVGDNEAKRAKRIDDLLDNLVRFDVNLVKIEPGDEYTSRSGFHYEPVGYSRLAKDVVAMVKKELAAEFPPISREAIELDDSWM